MGRIKSALEIALERTEQVRGDKSSIGLFEAKQRGKRLANQYLAGETDSLEAELKKAAGEEREALRSGCFDVLVTQITLPEREEELRRLEAVGKGLAAVTGDKRFPALYQRFMETAAQYMEDAAQFDEGIKRQYAPKLRQKEEELARRLGQAVRLDPFQDPEFVALYNQHKAMLKDHYAPLAGQIGEQARALFQKA
ncbi:MAG: hypothetical protein LBG84_09395 [Treponema sp.]|jgi:hypothetical protein|nr:hypothetical protein [Treponema sp.]